MFGRAFVDLFEDDTASGALPLPSFEPPAFRFTIVGAPSSIVDIAVATSDLFFDLAKENQVPLIPFLLEGVGGNPNYNLPDRIHPNAKGHELICDLVFSHLSKELKSNHP